MNSETRNCQNCKKDFTIEPDDFLFYEKIKVPPPTFCPECRQQRRMAWRNERVLHKRTCSATNTSIISYYRPDVPFPVYQKEYWYSDKWNPKSYEKDYDFSRPFFEQFKELLNSVPRAHAFLVNSINSDYTSYTVESKNCYLCFTALGGNEDCSYSSYLTKSKNSYDCHLINQLEDSYECLNCKNCNKLFYSVDSSDCANSMFLEDCSNCLDCIGCVALRNKQYYIFNNQYNKEEYYKKIEELKIDTRQGIDFIKKKMKEFTLSFPKKYMQGKSNLNSTGNYLSNSKNCHNSYLITNNEDCRYVYYSKDSKSYYDVLVSFLANEFIYESHAIPRNNYMVKFCDLCANGNNSIEYCNSCESSSNLFGCIALRKQEYCILNKQYTKEEYEKLIPKIIKHMNDMPFVDKKGRVYKYGEFFPIEFSPFGYNESTAQDFYSLSEKEIIENGFNYINISFYKGTYTPTISQIPTESKNIDDSFSKEILPCFNKENNSCVGNGVFRFTENEINFYKKNNIPPPIECPGCRQLNRISKRNPLKLWQRKCMKDGCHNEFETSYAPERPEIIYCESCYQQEMY